MTSANRRRVNLQPLNMRVDSKKRALIDLAVEELGGDRTSFVIEAACRRAEQVLLDKRAFVLDDQDFSAFVRKLDENIEDNKWVQKLMKTKPIWR